MTRYSERVRALLFDLDGTLYDQRKLRRAMALRLARAYWRNPAEGLGVMRALREYRRAQERLRSGLPAGADLAEAQFGCATENARALIRRWMEEEPLEILEAARFSGIAEALEAAKRAGLRLGLVSDYPAERKLQRLGLREYFEVVVSAQDAGIQRFKPDPAGLLAALERLRIEPGEAVYIGDRVEVDGVAARRAGMACWILGAKDGFNCYEELTKKLNALGTSR